MKYEEFIDGVADRTALPRDEAESLTRATLQVLGERLSGGEAEDLRAQLPKQLKVDLVSPREEAEAFDADEFAQRVSQRTGLNAADAGAGVLAVLATIREAVSPGEFEDVLAQLGREFAELVDATN
jgi:uncharacterized protein (DUF2267 family)